jgi:hypothetical protein
MISNPFSADDYDAVVEGVRAIDPPPTDDDLVVLMLDRGDGLNVALANVIAGARSGMRDDATDLGLRNLAWIASEVGIDRLLLLTMGPRGEVREDDATMLHRLRGYAAERDVEIVDLIVVGPDDWCSVDGVDATAA